MLVLSRYCDESVCIGDDIVITVVDVRSDRVRLGISAPTSVSVHRQEVYDAIAREKGEVVPERQERNSNNRNRDRRERTNRRTNERIPNNHQQDEHNNRNRTRKPPLEGKLSERRGKALPVEIETHNIGIAGITGMIDD
jgi:carbon storage regulator